MFSIWTYRSVYLYLVTQLVKNLPARHETACKARDPCSIFGLGRYPGEENGNPLKYSCLGIPMDTGDWQTTVHEVSRTGHSLLTKPPPPREYRYHEDCNCILIHSIYLIYDHLFACWRERERKRETVKMLRIMATSVYIPISIALLNTWKINSNFLMVWKHYSLFLWLLMSQWSLQTPANYPGIISAVFISHPFFSNEFPIIF